ncbi:unnamed protein product [Allacma fusca]|uniref:Sodium channel protein n=1 Tax=Allacma fusca TaxID=39272 RepID=A0A8J2Q192_9HEXA|nr:unnamed protein product [Allacma fusca]
MAEAHSTRSLRSQKSISSAKTTTRKETSTSLDDSNIDIDLSAKSSRQNFDIKSRCMPFFKRFWKNLGEGESKQQLQPNLYGRPLEEVDPFVFEDTFCVIAKKYGKHYIYRFSATRSLFIFGPLNPIRKIACRIISNQLFDLFIILVILANCVTLAMGTNWEVGTTGIMRVDEAKNQIIDVMEYIFLGIYTVEMTLKIISKGFMFNKFSYLRNSWNLLDFVVVSSGYITIGISQANVKNSQDFDFEFLRTLRVLRAIKTISILPGLRMMINALLSSVVQLLEVMALTLFCLMIFALLALELYMGKLLQKCVLIKNGAEHVKMVSEGSRVKSEITGGPIKPGTPNANRLWWEWVRRHDNWLMRVDDFPKEEYVPCGNDTWSRQCPEGYVCLGNMGENYDDGWTSFDTFFSSMLSTFQLITLDFWERPYDLILSSTTPWSVLFFLVVIFLGSFYLLNLMLAVVAMSYEEEYQQSTQVPLTKHQKLSLTRKASTFSFDDPVKLKVTAMTHYRKRTPSEREMIARTLKNSSLSRRKLRRMKRKNRLTSGDSTAGAGTPNVKSVTASICDESGVDFDSEGGSSLSDEGDSDSGLKQSKVFVGEVVSGQVNPCGVDLPISVTCCSGDKPDVQSTKQSDKKFHGGVAKVGVSVISSVDNDSQNFCIKIEEGEPRDVDGDEGKKRPNLHSAVMTLLGRQVSMDSKSAKDDRKSLESGTPPCSLQIFSVNPCTTASPCLPSRSASIPVDSKDAEMVSHLYSSMSPSLSRQNSTQSLPGAGSSPAKLRKRPSEEFGVEPSAARTIARSTKESISKFLFLLKSKLTPVVTHWAFEIIITSIIIFNTILLASEHHDQPQWLDNVLFVGNHFFTAAFLFEAIIKICALQRDYFRSIWNRFDLFVLAMSFVDSLFESYNIKFNAIRSMRLLRVFKLAQSWITMKVLLNIIFSTFGALGNLTLVLLIVLYIFAVLGLQVVGDYYTKKAFNAVDDEDEFPRWNFQNFWYAFMMVFRVICGEWIEPLWDCLKATSRKKDEYKCFFIFLPVLVVGNFIILNLFLALLLNSFDTEELNAQREKELEASGKSDNLLKIVGMLLTKKTKTENGNAGLEPISTASEEVVIQGDSLSFQEIGRGKARFKNAVSKVIIQNRKALAEKVIEQTKSSCSVKEGGEGSRRRSSFALGHREGEDPEFREHKVPGLCVPKKCWEMNCCMFNFLRTRKWKNWDAARGFAIRIVTHPFFEWFILALIFASSITLCFEDVNLDQRKELQEILFYINTTFTFIFVMEMILKWFALGLWKYFTSSWTLLDFFIVGISLVSWYYEMQSRVTGTTRATGSQLAALKALRTLRALRPLRAISRWQGMKIVVNALMFAIPSIFNVLLVCLLFWLIFSIMGVQFFKGKFYRCVENDSGDTVSIEKVKTRQECCNMTSKYSWVNTQPNFDNVFQGYLTLFQVATFEGWIEAMRAAVDSVDVDKQPQRDHSLEYYLFFVIFIVFGAFFTLNLFIGVIIDNFNRLKKKYEGNLLEALLTPSQRHYYTAMKKLGRKKPRKVIKRPTNGFLSIFYDISMSRRFEIAIFVMIFLNMVIMAFEHHNQRQIYVHILSGFNSFFTTIYGLEAIVKIVGLRQYYFTVPWNLFDFCLVIASIVDLAVGDLLGEGFPIPPTMLRIVRVFRIGRVLRLIKAAKGIRKLLFALVVSLPALFNIGALLALITFIYAILGMALFGKIAKNKAIDELFNFETFLRSCLMLLRIMTAAGWNDVLIAMTPEKPLCGTYRKIKCGRPGEGECANVGLAILYMVSYLLISYLIVINMYIAIILENFYEANREEEVGIVEDDLEMFYVRWSRYDPQATQFISFDQLSDFVASLDPPLGIPKPNIVAVVAFNLPIARGNKIHCLDILHALVKHVLGHIDDTEEFRKLQEQMEHKFRKQFPTRKLLDIISSTRVWKMQYNSAVTIQRTWRAYRARKYPPVEVVKSTQTLQSRNSIGGIQAKENQGMLNKMGNLLHLGQSKLQRRRVSMIEANNKPLKSDLEAKEHLSDISDSCYASFMPASPVAIPSNIPRPPLTRVEASSFDGQRGSVSPSRLSGGSFDAALTYGNGLNVQRNMGAPVGCSNSPVPSCPSSPSSVKGKSHSVIVQVHHPP